MNKLNELIQELCPDGVESFSIEKLRQCKSIFVIAPSFKLKSNEYKKEGSIPVISQEIEYISGYCEVSDVRLPEDEYVCFGDHSEHIKYIDFAFVQGADGLKIMTTDKNKLLVRYFYYAALNYYRRHDNYERHFKYLNDTQIPVPPLEVQREIVRILDNYTEQVEQLKCELNAELDARKKQYEYYRNELFEKNGNFDIVELGSVCKFVRGPFGGALKKEIFQPNGYAIYEQQHAIYRNLDIRYYIDEEKYHELKRFSVQPGDMIVSCSGTIGKTFIIPENAPEGVINQALLKLTPNENVNIYYLQYFFENTISKILNSSARGGAIKNVPSVDELKAIKMPLPSMDVQEKLVAILDRFDKLCNDISVGLPAEIEARQKQYEYYRNKLLTFKELTN